HSGYCYFGAGVVSVVVFFFFLPPLWPFLPLFSLPLSLPLSLSLVVVVPLPGVVVLSPPVWANDKLAPSNRANTNTVSLFISAPPKIECAGSFTPCSLAHH